MNLEIGANIKRLRAKHNATQEKLAEHLGVTTRAVSKWETGKAYPDITLLPGIANFFGVTFDELLKTEGENNEQRIAELFLKIADNQTKGKLDENIELLRSAVKEFPGTYEFLISLGGHLLAKDVQDRGTPEEPPEMRERYLEAQGLLERVLEYCGKEQLRLSARTLLFQIYRYLDDTKKQGELYEQMPSLLEQTTFLAIPDYYTGEARVTLIANNIIKLTKGLITLINMLADLGNDKFDMPWTPEDKIKILSKIHHLCDAVYENGDYGSVAPSLYGSYATMARLAAECGDAELALEYFEKAVEFAVMSDMAESVVTGDAGLTGLPRIPHTSVLVSKSNIPLLSSVKLTEENLSWDFLNITLKHSVFEPLVKLIGGTERYAVAIKKIEECAGAGTRPLANPFEVYLKNAEAGDTEAMTQLAIIYMQGEYTKRDETEAARWYLKAAENGNTQAANNLADMYEKGIGVERDYAQAMYWYEQSDILPSQYGTGNPWARVNIGDMHRNGLGVPQDYDEALKWYRAAEEKLFPLAHYRLGQCYEHGWGVERDVDKAIEYYEKSATPDPRFDGFYPLGGLTADEMPKKVIERLRGIK